MIEKVKLKSLLLASEYPERHRNLTNLLSECNVPIEVEQDKFKFIQRLMNQQEGVKPKATESNLILADTDFLGSDIHHLMSLIPEAGYTYLILQREYICKPPYDELGDVFRSLKCHYNNLG